MKVSKFQSQCVKSIHSIFVATLRISCSKRVYELDYIRDLQKRYASDPSLIERTLYAFGLLEAIQSVGMPFCFKGGTSLMLILDKPARLSTDIDILVAPGTDVDG